MLTCSALTLAGIGTAIGQGKLIALSIMVCNVSGFAPWLVWVR